MIFFHPDYTVGFGITPNPAAARLADYTADREFHPALKNFIFHLQVHYISCEKTVKIFSEKILSKK